MDEPPPKRSRLSQYLDGENPEVDELSFIFDSGVIDEGTDDEQQIAVEDDTSSSSEIQTMKQRAESLLESNFPRFIQKNCPTELGNVPVMCYHNKRDTNQISPTAIPIMQMCCLTIPCTALVSGASYFREFDLSTDLGRSLARLLRFLMRALCDPSLGTDPNYVDPIRNPRASFIGRQYNRDTTAPKVIPIVEPLFKAYRHTTTTVNVYGNTVPTPGAEFSKTEMFAADNVLGYRVWFFITDSTLDLTKAIIARIEKNNVEMGNAADYLTVSEFDPGMQEVFDTVFKADATKFLAHINRLNNGAKKANAENAKMREQFAVRARNSSPALLPYEFDSISAFFNLGRVKINQCFKCKPDLSCEECAVLPSASNKIIETMGTAIDIAAEYEEECAAAEREGREPGPPPDLTITYKNARFVDLPRSNVVATLMDGSVLSKDATIDHLVGQFIDPSYYLIHTNPSTMKMLEGIGVCARQLDPDQYTDTGARTHTPITFPFPDLVFTFSSADCYLPEFFDLRLPWVYDQFLGMVACLKSIIDKERRITLTRENRRFYDNVPGGMALTTLREAEISNNRIMQSLPAQIPIEFRGREFTEANQSFAPRFVDLPSKTSANNDNVIAAEDALRNGTKEAVKKIELLKSISKFIDTETMHYLIGILRVQGMREFKRLAVPDSETSPIVRMAANVMLTMMRDNRTAFFPTPRVAHNLNSAFADYIAQFYFYFESEGMLHNHHILMDLLFSVYRASHCPITDNLFDHTTLCNHSIMQGTAGMGKSFITDVLKRMILEHTAKNTSSMSERAMNSPVVSEGSAVIHDEMPMYFKPPEQNKTQPPKIENMRAMVKEIMTSNFLTHEIPQLSTSPNGSENVSGRRTVQIVSFMHNTFIIAANNYASNAGADNALPSRMTIYIINQPCVRYGASDITCKATPFGAADIGRIIASPVGDMRTSKVHEHALHVLYAKLLSQGGVGYPCLDMYSVLFKNVYKVLSPIMPGVTTNNRVTEQMTSRALAITIGCGINAVFRSLISPLIQLDHYNGTVEFLPFCLDQLKLVEPFTFMREDAAVSLIAQTFNTSHMPSVFWEIALKIAENFANFSLNPAPGFEPNYCRAECNGISHVNENYVQCVAPISEIIRFLNGIGVNSYSARYVIQTLASTNIHYPAFDMYPVPTPSSSASVVSSSIFNRANIRKPGKSVTMSLCTIESLPDKSPFANEETQLGGSSLRINVHYLRKFSPKQVTDMVVKACCHSGTRRRKIAINIPYAQLPFVMQTVELAPSEVDFDLDFKNTLDSHVVTAFDFTNLTFTGDQNRREPLPQRKKKKRLNNVDLETYLCEKWLAKNVVLPIDVSRYTPVEIDKEIARRTAVFSNEQPVVYPDDIIAKYTRPLPQHTAPEPISDPGSSGYEPLTLTPVFSRPDLSGLSAVVNRFSNNTPYAQRPVPGSSNEKVSDHTRGFRMPSSSTISSMSDEYDEFDE